MSLSALFNAPVEKVWKAITDKEQMKKWYFDIPAFKAETGAEFSFVAGDNDGTPWVHLCTVKEVIPNKKAGPHLAIRRL